MDPDVEARIDNICKVRTTEFDHLVRRIYPADLLLESGVTPELAYDLVSSTNKTGTKFVIWHVIFLALALFLSLFGEVRVSVLGVSVEFTSSIAVFLVIPIVATTLGASNAFFFF